MSVSDMENLLRSAGVDSADPLVATALQEYANRFASSLLCDAKDYANHAGHSDIEVGDAKIAVALADINIMSQDPRERAVTEAKAAINSIDLVKAVDDKTWHRNRYPKDPTSSDPTRSLLQRTYTIVPSTEALEQQRQLGEGQANQTDSFQPMEVN